MNFEETVLEDFDIGNNEELQLESSTVEANNTGQDDIDIYIPDDLDPDKEITQNIGGNNQKTNNDFATVLKETFGWENVPDDVTPVETLKQVVEAYNQELEQLRAKVQEYETQVVPLQYNEVIAKHNREYEDFKRLSPKDALKQYLMVKDELTDEEADEEIADMEADGKLEREYRKTTRKVEKEYKEEIEKLESTLSQQQEVERQRQEIEQKEAITGLKTQIQSFNSEYFEVTGADRQMIERVLLEPTENGNTTFQNMLNDPIAVSEMLLAYLNLPNWKTLPKTIEKKVQSKILNNMSNEPVFNSKITNTSDAFDIWASESVVENFRNA